MKEATTDLKEYYARPGRMTGVGAHADLLQGLPTDIAGLCQVLHHSLIHIFWAERYNVKLSEERQQAVQVRPADQKLALMRELDDRPLVEPRPLEQRLAANCRDYATLLCALLRRQGIPARARCGFGAYFLPNHYEDHWVCEYWKADDQRWVMVDAQLDAFQCEILGIPFDPLDVPDDQFLVAGKAWRMCRSGMANPDDFGIFDMHGLWFVRGNVVRDLLALNKIEILPWDGGWGMLTTEAEQATMEGQDTDLFDRIAELTLAGDAAFAEIRLLYESDERWHIPQSWFEAAPEGA